MEEERNSDGGGDSTETELSVTQIVVNGTDITCDCVWLTRRRTCGKHTRDLFGAETHVYVTRCRHYWKWRGKVESRLCRPPSCKMWRRDFCRSLKRQRRQKMLYKFSLDVVTKLHVESHPQLSLWCEDGKYSGEYSLMRFNQRLSLFFLELNLKSSFALTSGLIFFLQLPFGGRNPTCRRARR